MQRLVALFGGGLLGLACGSVLSGHLIAAVFGPTPVTWNAASCPPGTYTITATARSLSGPETFMTTMTNVRLPQSVVVTEFPNLPPGSYSVTARGQSRHGRPFESTPQIVEGRGNSIARGPRGGGTRGPSVPRSAVTQTSPSQTEAAAPRAVARPAVVAVGLLPPEARLLLQRVDNGNGLETEIDGYRIELHDIDGDGLVDVVSVEWISGEAWVRVVVDVRR